LAKNKRKNSGEKIELIYKKLIVGNGLPPIQQQITTISNDLKNHILDHEKNIKNNRWTFERIISIIAVIAVIYFGYQSLKKQEIKIDKNINIR
jgi:hypothetical protein